MKRCPRCGQTYTDNDINFCLNDGELLSHVARETSSAFKEDPPPTVMMDPPRVTDQANWQSAQPPANYQNRGPVFGGSSYGISGFPSSKDQSLPIVAIALGASSLVFVCCYGGVWLGIPAAVVGFMGLRNADKDPDRYSGRGLAIGGIVLGIVSFVLTILMVLVALLA